MSEHGVEPAGPDRPPLSPGRVIFDLFLLGIITAFLISTKDLHPRAAMVPLLIGVPTAVTLVVRTVLDIARRGKDYRPEPATAPADAEQAKEGAASLESDPTSAPAPSPAKPARPQRVDIEAAPDSEQIDHRREIILTVWSLVTVVGIAALTAWVPPLFGFKTYLLPVSFVSLVVIFRVIKLSWLKTILISVALVACMYYLLADFLHVRL